MPDNLPQAKEARSRFDAARDRAQPHIERLEILKEWIDDRRQRSIEERRAFIVEFAGMPKAGKSAAIENVRHFFTSGSKAKCHVWSAEGRPGRPYRVHTPAEGVSLRTPGLLKQSLFDYNSWAGAYALQELLQAGHDNYHDLVILDRGPWDAGCWLEYVKKAKLADSIKSSDLDSAIKFLQMGEWMTRADLHIVLTVDPAVAAERERGRRLIDHEGPASNPKLMGAMREIYAQKFSALQKAKAQDCPHVGAASASLIDTSKMEQLEIAADVLDHIFTVLKLKMEYHSKLHEEDVWRVVRPLMRGARAEELNIVEKYLPTFLDAAAKLPDEACKALRNEVYELDLTNEEHSGMALEAARHEGEILVERLKRLVERYQP